MAEKRIITSDIWQDEWFGQLPMFEQLLWIGLFSRCADDQGRLIDNPVVIRSMVFPYADIPVSQIETALVTYFQDSKIIRYEADGKKYIQIKNWFDHQQGQWAAPSKHPAPEGWKDKVRAYMKGEYREENWDKKNKRTPHPAPQVDTPAGQSTWTPQPTPQVAGQDLNLNHDLNHDLNHSSSKAASATHSPSNFPFDVDEKRITTVLMNVTGNMFIPAKQADFAVPLVHAVERQIDGDIQDYLTTYWEAWRKRGYSKTNYSWLEWAAAGEIPQSKKQPEPVQQATPEDLAEYAQEIIKARQEAK